MSRARIERDAAARPRGAHEIEGDPLHRPVAAPSILSADISRLAEELAIVDPRLDWVHCDVMDHRFVPNLTFGAGVVAAVSKHTEAYVEAHLMVEHPEAMVRAFRDAGADQITVHLEACVDPGAALAAIRSCGARAGLALKPATSLGAALPWLDALDALLVMTVEPGFGGQSFMPAMLAKVSAARDARARARLAFRIEVDGGIAPDTATRCREAGADVFVAGQAVFGQPKPRDALAALRAAIGG
jgi:ribulose-phosphate 3-epimerase